MRDAANNYLRRLTEINISGNDTTKSISEILAHMFNKGTELKSATEIANKASVSNAVITNFAKNLGYKNFYEIIFVHNSSMKRKSPIIEKQDQKYAAVSNVIQNSRKILFVGVSTMLTINEWFNNILTRMGNWTILARNKYEQIGLSKSMTKNDMIIVTSVSLQHDWMKQIINKTESTVLLITSSKYNKLKEYDIKFEINTSERGDSFRVYTSKNKNKINEELDKVVFQLMKNEENKLNLEKTSYK